MPLEEKVRPYEILIRLDANGVVGAQYQEISEILRDGVLISASVGEAKPIDANAELSERVLGHALATALRENSLLKERIAGLTSKPDGQPGEEDEDGTS